MSLVKLGEAALLKGQFEKSQWAFDAELYLHSPSPCKPNPSLWQRGLSCYYSGRYREGAEQFKADLSENGNDVEEVIWHFLCRCGSHGFQGAVADGFLPLRGDRPPIPPMKQVLDLYSGDGTVEQVLAAATSTDGSIVPSYNDTDALAYAHFYVGLYHEVCGELLRARHHLEAASGFENPDYMGKLMVMHWKLFCWRYSSNPSEHSNSSATPSSPSRTLSCPSNPSGFSKPSESLSDPSQVPLYSPEAPLKPPGLPSNLSANSSSYPAINISAQLIQGGWQLSEGHSAHCSQDGCHEAGVLRSLLRAFDAGIRCFDCGDIYTGVEALYGRFIRAHCGRGGKKEDVVVHTKLVPDMDAIRRHSVDKRYVESVVRRSLNRLGVERVSLVQFHWWDPSVPGYVDALRALSDLVRNGVVGSIGITNFNAVITKSIVDAGIQIASTQVQYSLLDRRPLSSGLVDLCQEHGIHILAYGVLAGGFLADAWLGKEKPSGESLTNRSLVKYLLVIEEFGGWQLFQRLLHVLRSIADRHGHVTGLDGAVVGVSIAMVAISYILRQKQVKGVIIGAHSDKHLQATLAALAVELTPADLAELDSILALSVGPSGGVYDLERVKCGPHASIMKYDLNQVNQGKHIEELCHRYLQLHFDGHPTEATRSGYRFPLPDSLHSELLNTISDGKEELDFTSTAVSIQRACSYDHSLGPSSVSEIQGYCRRVQLLLEEAEGVERDSLSPEQLVDLDIVISQLKLERVQWRTVEMHKRDPAFYLPLNAVLYLLPTWGPEKGTGYDDPTMMPHHPGVASMALCGKLLAILSRLRAIPSALLEAHRNLTSPLEQFVKTALDICGPFGSFLANDLPSLCSALVSEDKSNTSFAPILADVKSAAAIAAQCMEKYEAFLKNDLLPRSSASLGVGQEAYEMILKYSHFIDSSKELLVLGQRHFAEVKAELEALAADIDPTRTWQEITTDIIHPMHPSASNLLPTYMAEIQRCRDHMMSHDLVSALPEDEKVVGFSTPKFLIPFSPVGDYLNPSPFARMGQRDHHKVPRIGHLMLHSIQELKLSESEEQKLLRGHDYTWISVVSPHESYPGHHVQALLAQDHPRVLRKYHESILFYEGWGKYTEELAWETGFFGKELAYQPEGSSEVAIIPATMYTKLTRLTQLRLRLWRAARVILDVQLNTGELTFEGCREFLHREVMFNPGASKGEVFMYASRPGYAPCYLAGFVMIMELRQELRNRMEREGKGFRLREFHDTLLSKGCIPFKLLKTLL